MTAKIKHAKGERFNIRFNRKIRLEFHGARLTSEGGLLAYRELDEALGLFETEILALKENLEVLSEISGRWVEKAMERTPHHRIILDMDSSESPVHGEQEGSAYNLGNFLRRLVLPGKIKHWSLRSLLTKLIKIGAKVLRHSRYVTFQMAEVAISKEIFSEILLRINRLRCCSLQ